MISPEGTKGTGWHTFPVHYLAMHRAVLNALFTPEVSHLSNLAMTFSSLKIKVWQTFESCVSIHTSISFPITFLSVIFLFVLATLSIKFSCFVSCDPLSVTWAVFTNSFLFVPVFGSLANTCMAL